MELETLWLEECEEHTTFFDVYTVLDSIKVSKYNLIYHKVHYSIHLQLDKNMYQ